jgi:hypothetical protein
MLSSLRVQIIMGSFQLCPMVHLIYLWVKVGKNEPSNVWILLRNYFLKTWKITMGTLYIKKMFYFSIFFYTFKVATTKFPWKFTMFQKSFCMFKAFKKNMWASGFFVSIVLFIYQLFIKLFQINIFHKKGSMFSKHSKNRNTYIILAFNTQMSFYTNIVLNL